MIFYVINSNMKRIFVNVFEKPEFLIWKIFIDMAQSIQKSNTLEL